jgi:hypothetical protein
MLTNRTENPEVLKLIETALDLAGKESKQVILEYLKMRYGMDQGSVVKYRHEFENYLRETLGHSAEIVISKINEGLNKKINNDVFHAENGRNTTRFAGKESSRISDNVSFLICDNCFWCASVLTTIYESKCQSCGRQILSSVPIMNNERFIVEADRKRGVTLSFR